MEQKPKTITTSDVCSWGEQENITCKRCNKDRGSDYYVERYNEKGEVEADKEWLGICEVCKDEIIKNFECVLTEPSHEVEKAIREGEVVENEEMEEFIIKSTKK